MSSATPKRKTRTNHITTMNAPSSLPAFPFPPRTLPPLLWQYAVLTTRHTLRLFVCVQRGEMADTKGDTCGRLHRFEFCIPWPRSSRPRTANGGGGNWSVCRRCGPRMGACSGVQSTSLWPTSWSRARRMLRRGDDWWRWGLTTMRCWRGICWTPCLWCWWRCSSTAPRTNVTTSSISCTARRGMKRIYLRKSSATLRVAHTTAAPWRRVTTTAGTRVPSLRLPQLLLTPNRYSPNWHSEKFVAVLDCLWLW